MENLIYQYPLNTEANLPKNSVKDNFWTWLMASPNAQALFSFLVYVLGFYASGMMFAHFCTSFKHELMKRFVVVVAIGACFIAFTIMLIGSLLDIVFYSLGIDLFSRIQAKNQRMNKHLSMFNLFRGFVEDKPAEIVTIDDPKMVERIKESIQSKVEIKIDYDENGEAKEHQSEGLYFSISNELKPLTFKTIYNRYTAASSKYSKCPQGSASYDSAYETLLKNQAIYEICFELKQGYDAIKNKKGIDDTKPVRMLLRSFDDKDNLEIIGSYDDCTAFAKEYFRCRKANIKTAVEVAFPEVKYRYASYLSDVEKRRTTKGTIYHLDQDKDYNNGSRFW